MTSSKLRAWWHHRQGLDGSLVGKKPAEILEHAGWARSVAGAGPYLTLFARGRISRDVADKAVAKLEIHELPAARGCTYVLPASDYALGLTVARAVGGAEMKTAEKLGVTEKEIVKLESAVVGALTGEPLDPEGIRESVGKAARNLGEEGKKKGMITTLPVALGRLQVTGAIRRVPIGGRLDQQRYKYTAWNPNPLAKSKLDDTAAFTELARRYFRWVGPATLKEFSWFAGLGVKAAKEVVAPLGLEPVDDGDRLLLPEDAGAYGTFKVPRDAHYALVSSLDSITAARRDAKALVDDADRDQKVLGDRDVAPIGGFYDLPSHAILDRGRLIGLWEYDPDEQRIVWATFNTKKTKALQAAIDETEAFVRDDLGDARSFSLDSPKSRRPKLEYLKGL